MRRVLISIVMMLAVMPNVLLAQTCSDGNACTTTDRCESGRCVSSAPIVCPDDGNPCTIEVCDPGSGDCVSVANGCSDSNPCTADSCDPMTGCVHTPVTNGASCDDQNSCTNEQCTDGACVVTFNTNECNDGNVCTSNDICSEGHCIGTPLTGNACDDGNACTSETICVAGTCAAGTPTLCLSTDLCMPQVCNPTTGACDVLDLNSACASSAPQCTSGSCFSGVCQFNPTGGSCDDGNECTVHDSCVAGACVGAAVGSISNSTAPASSAGMLSLTALLLLAGGLAMSLRSRRRGR